MKKKEIWNVWIRVDDDHFPEHVAQYDNENDAEAHALRLMDETGDYDNYPGHIHYDQYVE